ncbi:MAG: NAD(P)-dependent oxidoreductase [Candidatus Latescibacteria bacterium]|jgi:nucleoside-diphosphate-sugar epimerase|nr:NAD(P)-dependent oxidoreductase [Candidatus Latescibacterota bacterium]
MPDRRKILITGAAGKVGSALRRYLRGRYDMRLLFHNTVPEVEPEDEVFLSDLSNFESMVEAGAGVNAIVHLGIATSKPGYPRSRYNQMILDTNVQGTYNVFESARINGVPHVIYASSNAVSGMYEREGVLTTPDMMPRPRDFYGVSKVFGEALGRHYHDAFGMSVHCIRICNFPNTDVPNQHCEPGMNRWLSARDMAELTACCLEAPQPQFGVFYGVSKGAEKKWDVSNARDMVGWEPVDDGTDAP